MASPTSKFTVQQVVDAVLEADGLISIAAKSLKCEPKTIRNYAKKHPAVAEAIVEADESTTDYVESQLMKNIALGKEASIIFYLKTKGKRRGYAERHEHTGPDGGVMQSEILIRYADDHTA